ncbi:MAG TPA: HpcH/HpaI aldolase/citrate lyase family protein, partial [Novosphingobium sp.]|nr:HpcH/HpaI aldolase/citrate lyase family protein [Novosphingobium sp.]
FRAEAQQGLEFGFDGKTLIHPDQIAPCNAVFSPSAEEVAWAEAVVAAFGLPENAGKGAIKVDGKMVELLHLDQARRVLAIAAAVA